MKLFTTAALAALGITALIEPVFAVEAAPGPVAGIGLPALAIVGGAYWLGRKVFGRKN